MVTRKQALEIMGAMEGIPIGAIEVKKRRKLSGLVQGSLLRIYEPGTSKKPRLELVLSDRREREGGILVTARLDCYNEVTGLSFVKYSHCDNGCFDPRYIGTVMDYVTKGRTKFAA